MAASESLNYVISFKSTCNFVALTTDCNNS